MEQSEITLRKCFRIFSYLPAYMAQTSGMLKKFNGVFMFLFTTSFRYRFILQNSNVCFQCIIKIKVVAITYIKLNIV